MARDNRKPAPSPRRQSRIERIEQIRALKSPVRQEILDCVQASGPSTVAEIAGDLGRAPENLYYHIGQLVEVELLFEVDERATNGRPEVVYDVAAGSLQVHYEAGDAENRAVVNEMVRSMLRVAGKDFLDGFTPECAATEGPCRNLWAARIKGWVNADDLEEVNRLLNRVMDILMSGDASSGSLVALTWLLAPVPVGSDADGRRQRR